MPSTGFHLPGHIDRAQLEGFTQEAAEVLRLDAHVLAWLPSGEGELLLVHLLEPNHTPEFWLAVERALPDYKARKQWLALKGGEYASL